MRHANHYFAFSFAHVALRLLPPLTDFTLITLAPLGAPKLLVLMLSHPGYEECPSTPKK